MGSTIIPLSNYSGNYFTGMSDYAQDLNNAIARQVQIASLPLELLQNNLNALNRQSGELQKLDTGFQTVQSAISALSSAAEDMLAASVSDPSVATAVLGSGAMPGTYSLQVSNLGSYSYALGRDGLPAVTDPARQGISSSGSYTLTVNGRAIEPPITPAGHDLNSLVEAINAADAAVRAAVVNVGTSAAPDYRISLQSEPYGNFSMQLNDGNADLLVASGDPGEPVEYALNGRPVLAGSREITVAPGLTVNLTGMSGGSAATISVAQNSAAIGDALESLVSAYNAAMGELSVNRGQSGGALAGQSIVYQLTNGLEGLANYSGGAGPFLSLAALGVSFDDNTGQLSFDRGTFDSATDGKTSGLAAFLGSSTGAGFLRAASDMLSRISDSETGILTTDIDAVQSTIDNTNGKISEQQDQISRLQQNLTQQMSAADALIYSLQQQANYFEQMFAAQRSSQNAGIY